MFFDFKTNFVYWEKPKNFKAHKEFILSQLFTDDQKSIVDEKKVIKNDIADFGNSELFMTLKSSNVSNGSEDNGQIDFGNIKTEAILPAFKNMLREMDLLTPSLVKLNAIWLNLYKPGGYVAAHVHEKVDISGLYIINLEEKNTTIFSEHSPCALTHRSFNTEDIEEGTIMLWPSHLVHQALPSKKNRVLVLFDLYVEIDYRGIFQDTQYLNF